MNVSAEGLTTRPATEVDWADVQLVMTSCADSTRCQCQRYKLRRGEAFANFPAAQRADRLRNNCARGAGGLIAYSNGDPVGWCAVAPRPSFAGLIRTGRVPWDGRDEDRTDPDIWAVTCFLTRPGHRRAGVSHFLARAAVTYAHDRGAHALEGYPTTSATLPTELHVGTINTFAHAGLTQVSQPTLRRVVMRIDFTAPDSTNNKQSSPRAGERSAPLG